MTSTLSSAFVVNEGEGAAVSERFDFPASSFDPAIELPMALSFQLTEDQRQCEPVPSLGGLLVLDGLRFRAAGAGHERSDRDVCAAGGLPLSAVTLAAIIIIVVVVGLLHQFRLLLVVLRHQKRRAALAALPRAGGNGDGRLRRSSSSGGHDWL